ncbi:MAG: hypothetical protein AB7G39_05645 [Alphaproteobacteria bacterium]
MSMESKTLVLYAGLILPILSLGTGVASAAGECPYLTRPLVESVGGTTRMNRWANGTKLCHEGRSHVCTDGSWKLYEPCSDAEPRWRDHMAWRLEGGKEESGAPAGSSAPGMRGNSGAGSGEAEQGGTQGAANRNGAPLAGRWCHPGQSDTWLEFRGNQLVSRFKKLVGGGYGTNTETGTNSGGVFTIRENGTTPPLDSYTATYTLLPDGTMRWSQKFDGGTTQQAILTRCN